MTGTVSLGEIYCIFFGVVMLLFIRKSAQIIQRNLIEFCENNRIGNRNLSGTFLVSSVYFSLAVEYIGNLLLRQIMVLS